MSTRAFTALVAVVVLGTGCLGDYTLPGEGDGGAQGDGNVAVGDGPGGLVDPVAEFNDKVKPIIAGADGKSGACGACHAVSGGVGPGFMVDKPTMLDGLLSYPGIVGKSPLTSRLYAKGLHEGPAFTPSESPVIANWIIDWNLYGTKVVDMGPPKPIIKPFAPAIGANTVDLSVLDSTLAGMTVTFNASITGTNLTLTGLSVKTAASIGLHVVHPLFVSWDPQFNATPDPIDSFSNLDQTILQNSTSTLGPGVLVIPNFSAGFMLSIVFGTIEAKATGTGDGGVVLGCTTASVTNFAANVRPIIAAQCYNCHGGNPPAAGFPMAAALSNQAICDSVLGEVNLTTPANSLFLTHPDPANGGVHNGAGQKITNFGPFSTAVNAWITIQKM